jgi:hypothetical protein
LSAQTLVLLGSTFIPPILAIAVYWFGFRLAKRHDEREKET